MNELLAPKMKRIAAKLLRLSEVLNELVIELGVDSDESKEPLPENTEPKKKSSVGKRTRKSTKPKSTDEKPTDTDVKKVEVISDDEMKNVLTNAAMKHGTQAIRALVDSKKVSEMSQEDREAIVDKIKNLEV